MKTIKIFLITFLGMSAFAYAVGSPPVYMPKKINYQGKIEIDGEAYTGNKSFNFKIFDALTLGTEIWDSGPVSLDVSNGVFSATLEGGTPTLSTATFSGERWLEIAVGGVTLTPREEIVPPPFAMVAAGVTPDVILPAGQLTGVLPDIDGSNLSGVFVTPNHITWGNLPANVIASSIAAGVVLDASIVTMNASKLTGTLPSGVADNLGNHIATTTLQMGAYGINTSSFVSAGAYQINGSMMVAMLPGSDSIAYGVGAGLSNIIGGDYNTFIGNDAGKYNTTGDFNTANGYQTLYRNTTGNENTANGSYALYNNMTGSSNTANGAYALYENTTGNNNTATGYTALYLNMTGNFNTANGYEALFSNMDGSFNTANGNTALYSNTTGSYNTANGYKALYYNTTGKENTANGNEALYNNTTGNNNTANGSRALRSNTTGDYNAANGYYALWTNTTGSFNTANGYALSSNTEGSYNTANGYQALQLNKTGNGNTANGSNAGRYNTTGSANTLMGYYAGEGTSGNSFSSSTIMGYQAGLSLTTGSDNILLGFRAGDNLTSGSSNIIIGYDLNASGGSGATKELNIGGLIKGTIDGSSVTVVGDLYADVFHGDGSGLSNIAGSGDNLGNHVATTTLNMSANAITGASSLTATGAVNAGSYQVGGSSVLELSGTESLSVGVQAGIVNTGYANVFLGQAAGKSNTGAGANSFLGAFAGQNNAGYENTFVGNGAGRNNTTGIQNSFVGANAGYGNESGSNNTVLGYAAAMSDALDNSFSNSTIIGYKAGWAIDSGSNNILLGYQAGDNLETGNGNIIIGYDINTTAIDTSNELNIGDVIKGDLTNKTVGIGAKPTSASNILELTSTTQGFVLPRMTLAQRDAIVTPVAGMMIWQTDNAPGLYFYNGTQWMEIATTI
jgi:hypothetical protein